jgi:hypothetical protein
MLPLPARIPTTQLAEASIRARASSTSRAVTGSAAGPHGAPARRVTLTFGGNVTFESNAPITASRNNSEPR